jgi:hypothetical protein
MRWRNSAGGHRSLSTSNFRASLAALPCSHRVNASRRAQQSAFAHFLLFHAAIQRYNLIALEIQSHDWQRDISSKSAARHQLKKRSATSAQKAQRDVSPHLNPVEIG